MPFARSAAGWWMQLGVEPSSELVELHQSILNHDPDLLPHRGDHQPRTEPPGKPAGRVTPAALKRLVALAVVVVVILAVAAGYAAWHSRSPALQALPANSVARIDQDGTLHDAVTVGVGPDGVAVTRGAAWVANTGTDSISKIDLDRHLVVQTTQVGNAPEAVAVSSSDLWVVNSGSASVSRVSLGTNQVVDTIHVGNQPSAIAVGDTGIWVVNSADGTVVRIDPSTGDADEPIAVRLRPDGIVADADTVWVANGGDGTVSPIDAESGICRQLDRGGRRPLAW